MQLREHLHTASGSVNKIKQTWKEVINKIMIILPVNIPLDSKMVLCHIYPTTISLRVQEYKFIHFALLQAKRTIAVSWKKTTAPKIGTWIKNMAQCMALEKITYILKKK